jgi:hypothetical protein
MLIFASEKGLDNLRNSTNFGGDGTFSSRTTLFDQHWLLHSKVEDSFVPSVFVLMSGKTEAMYTRMIDILKAACGVKPACGGNRWAPQTIMLDFEKAAMNAFAKAFPYFSSISWILTKLSRQWLLYKNPVLS